MNKYPVIQNKQKSENEFEDKVLEIRRVVRVVAGGKRFSFRSVVVLGDKQGRVGIGVGKGLDVAESIRKAKLAARKNVVRIHLDRGRTIVYDVDAKYGAARVRLKPAKKGHGLIAGGAARVVLELAGIKDITAKLIGTTGNKLNNALVTLRALEKFERFI